MSLFKKPTKQKFRSRVTREDTDEDENNEEASSSVVIDGGSNKLPSTGDEDNNVKVSGIKIEPGSSASIQQQSQPVASEKKFDPKVKLKLSFGDDEEEDADVFQVKKSAYSRRIAKQLKRDKKKKEKEDKLKESKKGKGDQIFSFNSNKDTDSSVEMEIENVDPPKIKETPVAAPPPSNERFIDTSSYHEFKPLREGQFPSAKEIYAARKKREEDRKKMRMDNVIEDFIAIEEETAAGRAAMGFTNDEQPIYEEEPDNEDDDDDDDRIDFAVDLEALERERAKEAFIQAQEEDEETFHRSKHINHVDSDSEDELDLWEKEQIRKGVGHLLGSVNRDQSGQSGNSQLNDLMTKLDIPSTSDKYYNSSIPSYLSKIPNGEACEELIKQISDAIAQMEREITEDEQELRNVKADREQLLSEVKELEEKLNINELEEDSEDEGFLKWGKRDIRLNKHDDSSDDD